MTIVARTRRPGHLLVIGVAGLALVAGVLLLSGPSLPPGVLSAVAADDSFESYRQSGQFRRNGLPLRLTLSYGTMEKGYEGVKFTWEGSRFYANTVAILAADDSVLTQQVGLRLFKILRDAQRFTRVYYVPPGQPLPYGEPVPEVFISLELAHMLMSGVPGMRNLSAEFHVSIGSRHGSSPVLVVNELSPPRIGFSRYKRFRFDARQVGIELPGARHAAVSKRFAVDIAAETLEYFNTLSSRYGGATAFQAALYPDFMEPPDFEFLPLLNAERVMSGPALMTSTVAVWRISEHHGFPDVLRVVESSLIESGWESWSAGETQSSTPYFRASQADKAIEVYVDRRPYRHKSDTELLSVPYPTYIRFTRYSPEYASAHEPAAE